MRSYSKRPRKSTVISPNLKSLQKQADKVLYRWADGRYVGMDNLDMRCPGDCPDKLPGDDVQVELCHALAKRWTLRDQLIAKAHWGSDESKRSVSAISLRLGLGRTKTENRIEWMRDCVIESCVKVTTIYG